MDHKAAKRRARVAAVQEKLNNLTYEDCDPQEKCPLFNTLPGELRNEVFKWALVQYDDPDPEKRYREDSYWYRPGFKTAKRSESGLLRTCKLIFCESRRVVMREAEHAFWFDRGPEGRSGTHDCVKFFDNLKQENVEDLASVRFSTQMYWIESGYNLNYIFRQTNFRPQRLTITFRYSDWWWWESNDDLAMSEEWLSRFNGPPGLKELCVEYETIAWKKAQMDAIVARNKNWKLTLQDGNHLSAADTKLLEWKWAGPSKLGGQSWNHHGDGDTIDYVVVVDRWVWKEGELPEEDKKKRSVDYEEVDDEFGTPPSFHDGNDDHGDEDWDEEDSEDEDSDG